MPFTTVKTEELIENMKQKDAEFAKQWDESRNEYNQKRTTYNTNTISTNDRK